MKKYFKTLLIIFILSIQIKTYSQIPKIDYDFPEPFKACMYPIHKPFQMIKWEIPLIKSVNETEEEFQNKITKYKTQNDEADRTYQKMYFQYVQDSIRYEKCNSQWEKKLLEWRKRNPNWRRNSIYKDEIIKSKNYDETIQKQQIAKYGETYIVNSKTLNIRKEPNKTSDVIANLTLGDKVKLLNSDNSTWWLINDGINQGYVFSQFLKLDPYSGWEKKNYISGETPECENIVPQYDNKINNYLKINVGSHTDVVIKLMKKKADGDICIRIIYIRKNETYYLRNIPEGNYYLKIAYGSDWRQKIVDQNCYGKFMKNALYKIGEESLDYNIIHKYDRVQIPSFELSLDLIVTNESKSNFNSNEISEIEFNK